MTKSAALLALERQMAANYAAREVRGFIHSKFKKLSATGAPILGPVLDETDFFRIGKEPNVWSLSIPDLIGYYTTSIDQQRASLIKKGFPDIVPGELSLMTELFADQLKQTLPNRNFVGLHFPGGGINLTKTHAESVHYGNHADIQRWLGIFRARADMWGMMLSHATYDLNAFPGIERTTRPQLPPFIDRALRQGAGVGPDASDIELYSRVPATFNPYIINYLRENVGFKGLTVSDWFEMNAPMDFVDKINLDHLIKPILGPEGASAPALNSPSSNDKSFLLSVVAGIEAPESLDLVKEMKTNPNFWQSFQEHSPNEFAQFEVKLNERIAIKYLTLTGQRGPTPQQIKEWTDRIAQLPLEHRFNLMSNPIAVDLLPEGPQRDTYSALSQVIHRRDNDITANDLWRRKGVLTMEYRVAYVRYQAHLDGAGTLEALKNRWPDAPITENDEKAWADRLLADPQFRKIYDRINWQTVSENIDLTQAAKPDAPYIDKTKDKVACTDDPAVSCTTLPDARRQTAEAGRPM